MNQQISKPIVYGSIATWLGKKADDKKTHSWICYVRGLQNENLNYFIDKVSFVLHHSFPDPTRTVTQHPFVIQETGWGQFQIQIKIYLKGFEAPLVVYHQLKLYHSQNQNVPLTKRPIVHEQYDEVVFVNPQEKVMEILNIQPEIPQQSQPEVSEEDNEIKDIESENLTAQQYLKQMHPHLIKFDEKELQVQQKQEFALNFVQNELLVEQIKKNRQIDEEIQELQIEAERLQLQLKQSE